MKNVTILGAILFLVTSCNLVELNLMRDFSKESWKNNPSERYLMSTDLQENHLPEGMLKAEVVNLLGEHTTTYYDSPSNCQISEYDMGSTDLTSYALCIAFRDDILIYVYESTINF